jgi:predicted SAM-dependent methyltransferase
MDQLKLNLGAADRHIDGYRSVDLYVNIRPTPEECKDWQYADLNYSWPWLDSSVDEIIAFDIIEHLPNRIHTMNEMHRVLKPGAIAQIEVPNATQGAGFAQDPTHQSQWCMNSFQYYEEGSFAHKRFAVLYGITARFKIVKLWETSWQDAFELTWKVHAILEAVK